MGGERGEGEGDEIRWYDEGIYLETIYTPRAEK